MTYESKITVHYESFCDVCKTTITHDEEIKDIGKMPSPRALWNARKAFAYGNFVFCAQCYAEYQKVVRELELKRWELVKDASAAHSEARKKSESEYPHISPSQFFFSRKGQDE